MRAKPSSNTPTSKSHPTISEFEYLMDSSGWAVFPGVYTSNFLNDLRNDLDELYRVRKSVQKQNGVDQKLDGAAHHLFGFGTSLDSIIFDLPLADYIGSFFGGDFVLNSFGGVVHSKSSESYLMTHHRDVRSYCGGKSRVMLNMLVMLDDFTLENGATHILSGSHHIERRPTDKLFSQSADRITGEAGDIAFWDSNVFHAAGNNLMSKPRRCLTIGFSLPFVKPLINFETSIEKGFLERLSLETRELIGLNARPAESLEQFYQPIEKRSFRSNK